jgi:hypothetical protein
MVLFNRQNIKPPNETVAPQGASPLPHHDAEKSEHHVLPVFNHNGHKVTKGIHPDGESGRKGVHPWHFLRVSFRSSSKASMIVNVLWPVVPVAIAFVSDENLFCLWSSSNALTSSSRPSSISHVHTTTWPSFA